MIGCCQKKTEAILSRPRIHCVLFFFTFGICAAQATNVASQEPDGLIRHRQQTIVPLSFFPQKKRDRKRIATFFGVALCASLKTKGTTATNDLELRRRKEDEKETNGIEYNHARMRLACQHTKGGPKVFKKSPKNKKWMLQTIFFSNPFHHTIKVVHRLEDDYCLDHLHLRQRRHYGVGCARPVQETTMPRVALWPSPVAR